MCPGSWPHKLCSWMHCLAHRVYKTLFYAVLHISSIEVQNTKRILGVCLTFWCNAQVLYLVFCHTRTLSSWVENSRRLQKNDPDCWLRCKKHNFFCNIYKAGLCDPPTQWNYSQSSLSHSQILPNRVRAVNNKSVSRQKKAFMLQSWLVQTWGYSYCTFMD